MKTIVCYGDSNTWGLNPETQRRFPRNIRWPGKLQIELGQEYHIIEEGLSGRTTVWDDPIEEHKNGKTYLYPCLESHKPIDLIILMLGTNDLKKRFSLSPFDVSEGIKNLIKIIRNSQSGPQEKSPHILLLSPPLIGKLDKIGEEVFEGASAKSKILGGYLNVVGKEHHCWFLDTAEFLQASQFEGLHLDEEAHFILAQRIAATIKKNEF